MTADGTAFMRKLDAFEVVFGRTSGSHESSFGVTVDAARSRWRLISAPQIRAQATGGTSGTSIVISYCLAASSSRRLLYQYYNLCSYALVVPCFYL